MDALNRAINEAFGELLGSSGKQVSYRYFRLKAHTPGADNRREE